MAVSLETLSDNSLLEARKVATFSPDRDDLSSASLLVKADLLLQVWRVPRIVLPIRLVTIQDLTTRKDLFWSN